MGKSSESVHSMGQTEASVLLKLFIHDCKWWHTISVLIVFCFVLKIEFRQCIGSIMWYPSLSFIHSFNKTDAVILNVMQMMLPDKFPISE